MIVPSEVAQRKVSGPVPAWASVVDEAWLNHSFMRGELQAVREYYVDVPPTRKRKSSALSPPDPPAAPKPTRSRAKRPAPAPEPEPEPDLETDMVPDDDSDDESYCATGDEGDSAASAQVTVPSDADIGNVWFLIDELREWDKKGQIRHQLERCSREGIANARKLYYTYKAYIKTKVPDLQVRKSYKKRARVH